VTVDEPPITLTIAPAMAPVIERLLLKMKAGELSDLRRVQTQLSVYGDRRANMVGEPADIQARIDALDGLLEQLRTQR
jgi:hypothetical protein